MTRSPARLSRRELFTLLLGAHAAAWSGCSRSALPPAGELLSPNIAAGHRLRDGQSVARQPNSAGRKSVVIVGAGIAGLAAGWRLRRAGLRDITILEIDDAAGGTARGDQRDGYAFPWGAHYVPTPMQENVALITLLTEMGVIRGSDRDGEPIVAEQYLCRDPQERVFFDGQWLEGLYPYAGASEEDLEQLRAFRQEIDQWIERRDSQGKRMFAIPMSTGSDCAEVMALDEISMSQWMDRQGWTSTRLRWLVDYSCRDDFGLTLEQTSAWAGVFYFASRSKTASSSSQDIITWPQGNGQIVDYLKGILADSLHCAHAVYELAPGGTAGTTVTAIDGRTDRAMKFDADQVIFAAPQFVAPYVIRGFEKERVSGFQYGAWLVANVHLRDRPAEHGFPMCWDNVIYNSQSLGYVTATHQQGRDYGPTVLTWYYPLTQDDARVSRQQLLGLKWEDWAAMVVADLDYAHPGISDLIHRLDIMRWGHAMIQPHPGFVWSQSRRDAAQPLGSIHFANTDLSGVALMEEAFFHGVRAAEEVLQRRDHSFKSIL